MQGFKRVLSAISILLCITIIWIPFHFVLKTLLYGDKRENQSQKVSTIKNKSEENL